MKPEKLIIVNKNKDRLVGYLYKNTSKTIVIFCHGVDSMNMFPGIDEAFQMYHATGASVFSFDFSGHGESEGKKKVRIKQRLADVEKVIDYFAKDYKEIIIYGVSMGGVIAAIAAIKDKRITKLVAINGLFSLDITKLYFSQIIGIISYLLFHPKQLADVYYWLRDLQTEKITIPTLIVYGEEDKIVNPKQSIDFYNKLKTSKTLIPIPNGDHALMKKEFLKDTIAVPNWIREQIVY